MVGPAELSAGAKGRFRSCLGGEGVQNSWGFVPSPFLCCHESLLGITAPNFAGLSSPLGIRDGESRGRAGLLRSSLPYSSCSASSLGLTGVPGLGRKKIYKTLLNQQ